MSAISAAVYTALAGDTALINILSFFDREDGSATKPSVFTYEPIPKDTEYPYIISVGEVGASDFDTKTTTGRRITRDIRIYDAERGSSAPIETIAERVYNLFHRQPLTITGFDTVLVQASPPINVDEQDAYGRIVTLSMVLQVS